MNTAVHHFEFCVSDLEKYTLFFVDTYGFSLLCSKDDGYVKQNVVKSGECVFILTKRITASLPTSAILTCCRDTEHRRDSVFNVAIQVKNVDRFCENYQCQGGKVLCKPQIISDESGSVTFAQVQSICGNIIHTVLNKEEYFGSFLPGYEPSISKPQEKQLINSIDHVTFVCEPSEMNQLIDFYERTFGMKRFMINREDDEEEGLVIKSNVGMRLKVMDFWRCAEVGLKFGTENKISIVLAEALPDQENSHIQTYLKEHGGPGIQHIGLRTDEIVSCVSQLTSKGALFRKPPGAYYSSVGKLDEIVMAGENVEEFRNLGILIDAEADALDDGSAAEVDQSLCGERYLLQIFSLPIFDQDTFFLEVIQRKGASGFGAGNVTALARSIEEEQKIALNCMNEAM